MAFIPNGFGQVTWVFAIPGPGGPAMCTAGFIDNPASTPNTIADTLQLAWTATGGLSDGMDSTSSLQETRVLIRRGGALVAGIDTTVVAGSVSGDAAPPQVACLIQKQTGFAGRDRRGRLYVPAVVNPGETGVRGAGSLAVYQTGADALLDRMATASLDMHLLHVDQADTPTPVTALVAIGLAATQRRRLR